MKLEFEKKLDIIIIATKFEKNTNIIKSTQQIIIMAKNLWRKNSA
jgi:hypothetical protein